MQLKSKFYLLGGILTKRYPLYVQFAVSKHCNLRCKMCAAVESRRDERELTCAEIDAVAQILAALKTTVVVLTGGEPTLRRDILDIVYSFSHRGMEARLQTNGQLITEPLAWRLREAGLSGVTISLDSLDSKKQDYINGWSGSWARTIEAMDIFAKVMGTRRRILGVNTVVSRLNIEEMPDIVKYASRKGYYISLIPVHLRAQKAKDTVVRAKAEEFGFQRSDFSLLDGTYQELLRLKRHGAKLYNSYRFLRESVGFLKGRQIKWKCESPYRYFGISPSGNFLPCVDIKCDEPMLSGNFVKRYFSREFRNKIRGIVASCPGCFYACWPEITYFCTDPMVMWERFKEGLNFESGTR